jgi:predicted SAM-dependent methyltransferase
MRSYESGPGVASQRSAPDPKRMTAHSRTSRRIGSERCNSGRTMDQNVLRRELVRCIADGRRLIGCTLDELRADGSSRRFSAAVSAAAPQAHVAIGVGSRPLHNWICTDVTRDVDFYLDLTKPWPVPDGAVSHIYGDNVIEHFTVDVGRRVLLNCRGALAANGRIRLSTPDLERAARAYLDGSELGREHLAHYANSEVIAEHPVDLVRMLFAYNGHWAGYLYDEATLTEELLRAGFHDVRRCEPGKSDDDVFAGVESRTTGSFNHFQLVLEASV